MNEDELETVPEMAPGGSDVETAAPVELDVQEIPAADDPVTVPDGYEDQVIDADPSTDETDEAAERTDVDTGDGDETGEDGGGNVTNVTIVRPPMQQITYYADEDAEYHVTVENDEDAPVPVIIVESVKEPGIMEKRFEDYTVTEGLLLCILIVLLLYIVLDYGRRLF